MRLAIRQGLEGRTYLMMSYAEVAEAASKRIFRNYGDRVKIGNAVLVEPLIGSERHTRRQLAYRRGHRRYGEPVHDGYGGIALYDERWTRLSVG